MSIGGGGDEVFSDGLVVDLVSVAMSAMGWELMIGSLSLSVGSRTSLGRPRRCHWFSLIVATILVRTMFFWGLVFA